HKSAHRLRNVYERPDPDDGFSPIRVMEIELTSPIPAIAFDGRHHRIYVLSRLHTEPIGSCYLSITQDGLTSDELADTLWNELGEQIRRRFAAAALSEPSTLTADGLSSDAGSWPSLLRRSQVVDSAPFISVVICTRDRTEQLQKCLSYLDRQHYPNFEVV